MITVSLRKPDTQPDQALFFFSPHVLTISFASNKPRAAILSIFFSFNYMVFIYAQKLLAVVLGFFVVLFLLLFFKMTLTGDFLWEAEEELI